MTITELEQYAKLKNEILHLNKRIDALRHSKSAVVSDTVKASSRQKPYQERIVTITGISQAHMAHIDRLEDILRARLQRAQKSYFKIEEFINTIEDSGDRQLIGYHYLQGLTWNAAAGKVYGYPCGDRARKAVNKLLS